MNYDKSPAAQERALKWLIENDPEAAEFWAEQPADTDFVKCKRENLRDFGPEEGFVKYSHHGVDVWVREDLKGTHRANCLCFACDKFQGGGKCPIANELYALCVKHNLTTPVFECPHWVPLDTSPKSGV